MKEYKNEDLDLDFTFTGKDVEEMKKIPWYQTKKEFNVSRETLRKEAEK